MTNRILLSLVLVGLVALGTSHLRAQTYAGSQYCQVCHSNASIGGVQYTQWSTTLHSKIHLLPDAVSIRPLTDFTNGYVINMGSSYGNAIVTISRVGNDFFAQVGSSGTTYRIAYTYGWGWKQRYLVKIDTSYYMLPIQYNLNKYLDNSTGTWVTYNPGNWFNTDGSVKNSQTNSFRTKSWDKNCMGCHVTGGRVDRVVNGADTTFKATWANNSSTVNVVVGCESCHGPSALHTGGPSGTMSPNNLPKAAKMEVCGQCHNRASSNRGSGLVGTHEFPKNELNNTYFNPADTTHPLSEFLNTTNPPNAPGGPGTWPDLITARQHHQQYQEMLGSAHYTNPWVEMTCITCHSSHSTSANPHLLRDSLRVGTTWFRVRDDNNTLCLSCHATHGPFASLPTHWVENPVTYNDSIAAVVNLHTRHDTYDPGNSQNTGGIGRCTNCHLNKTAVTAKSYDISSHTFNVISPQKTLLYQNVTTPTQGMLNTCSSCHRNPSGSTSNVPGFGIGTDPTFTNWREATDIALAETVWAYWQLWGFTGVREVSGTVPSGYALSQNFPNPFNPSTRIFVDIRARSDVRLVVYGLTGQQVAVLMAGNQDAGRYEVIWNGKDDSGFNVPSGVYFYRLDAGSSFQATRKMILLR